MHRIDISAPTPRMYVKCVQDRGSYSTNITRISETGYSQFLVYYNLP